MPIGAQVAKQPYLPQQQQQHYQQPQFMYYPHQQNGHVPEPAASNNQVSAYRVDGKSKFAFYPFLSVSDLIREVIITTYMFYF